MGVEGCGYWGLLLFHEVVIGLKLDIVRINVTFMIIIMSKIFIYQSIKRLNNESIT